MERNLLIAIRFVGTNYHGFQVQQNALSICTVFQDSVEKVFGVRHGVKGCSRTDAGVHAGKYCVSMKTENPLPCEKIPPALNAHLPDDIAALDCAEVPAEFHARYSSTGKEYLYRLRTNRLRDPFSANLCYRVDYNVDASLLHREAQSFVGRHDFAAFQAKGGNIDDTVRTVTDFSVTRSGDMVNFLVRGDGFLYKMVRIMVGTLLHISAGRIPQGAIPGIIAGRDRANAGKTAPACGLYLNDVFYRDSG